MEFSQVKLSRRRENVITYLEYVPLYFSFWLFVLEQILYIGEKIY